jgi:hypothetical protein
MGGGRKKRKEGMKLMEGKTGPSTGRFWRFGTGGRKAGIVHSRENWGSFWLLIKWMATTLLFD